MNASTIIDRLKVINRWYLVLAKTKYPQWLTSILGAGGGGVGVLFILNPERFLSSTALSGLSFWPPTTWGLIFLTVGVSLITTSIVNPSSSGVLCVILGLALFLFAVVTAPTAFEGNSTGLSAVFAATLGFLCFIGMLASISPQIEQIIERGSKESKEYHGKAQ